MFPVHFSYIRLCSMKYHEGFYLISLPAHIILLLINALDSAMPKDFAELNSSTTSLCQPPESTQHFEEEEEVDYRFDQLGGTYIQSAQ
ncbi:hypothetical protein DAI22_06g149850 [Oryza sativa Japonica Group]|nr:hypothetical protein DAI22_06g149850 [Oryza sativa Japonica Group]